MSINLKLELEHLMSKPKQDIWGKHEGCPEMNKPDFCFTIRFLRRDLCRRSKTVTYLCWHQALGQPWRFFRHNVPCTNLFADVGYDTARTCQTLGAVPSSVERYLPSEAHPCLTSVTWARSKSSIDENTTLDEVFR